MSDESLRLNLAISNADRDRLSSENTNLENENALLRRREKELTEALQSLYDDVRSDNGLDDWQIEEDTSSLGVAKKLLKRGK